MKTCRIELTPVEAIAFGAVVQTLRDQVNGLVANTRAVIMERAPKKEIEIPSPLVHALLEMIGIPEENGVEPTFENILHEPFSRISLPH